MGCSLHAVMHLSMQQMLVAYNLYQNIFFIFSVLRTPTAMGTVTPWQILTDRWTCALILVVPSCYTKVVRTRKTSIVGCAGIELLGTTSMPYLASLVKPSSEEMRQKDW